MSNKTDPPRRKRKRSAYHPALACVVERHKPTNTEVLTEYQLTSEPLKADILLIRKRKEAKNDATILRGLWGLLPRRTIMEFKSIRTGLRRGDLSRLFGYAHIYDYSKLRKVPHKDELATVLLVPSQTRVLQEELKRLSLRWEKIAPGYFEVLGPTPFTCFVVVIDEVALDEQDPILGIFGHKKISSKLGPIPAWEANMVKTYLRKQNVDEQNYDDYDELMDSLFDGVSIERRIKGIPPEKLLEGVSTKQRLEGIPNQERLRGIPSQERLRGIPSQERLRGIPSQERLRGIPSQERLKGIPNQERLRGIPSQERLEGIPNQERLANLSEEEQILALSDAVLASFPESYIRSLPEKTQEKIRRRLRR